MSTNYSIFLCAALALASPQFARAEGWGLLNDTDGGFPEPNAVYHRIAIPLAQLEPGMGLELEIICPEARYFAVNVYNQETGSNLAFATDRQMTGSSDLNQPACKPGTVLRMILAAKDPKEKETPGRLEIEGMDKREGTIEIWVRAYLGKDFKQPKISLISADRKFAGHPETVDIHHFQTEMGMFEAKKKQANLPPGPQGNNMTFFPTNGSGVFPNGQSYLVARLDDKRKGILDSNRRFNGNQFAVVKFKPPTTSGTAPAGQTAQVRYWSLSALDGPSSQILRNTDGSGACLNDQNAKLSADGTLTIIIGSPETAAIARQRGLNALPVYYPKPIVAMPVLLYRNLPNDPNFSNSIPTDNLWPGSAMKPEELSAAMGEHTPQGRYFPIEELEAVLEAAEKSMPAGGPKTSKVWRRPNLPNAEKLLGDVASEVPEVNTARDVSGEADARSGN